MAKVRGVSHILTARSPHDLSLVRPIHYAHTPLQKMEHNESLTVEEAEAFFNLGEGELQAALLPADEVHHVWASLDV